MPKYKLKDNVTEEELQESGFVIQKAGLRYYHRCATKDIEKNNLYIPLEECEYGNRIIQYVN